MKRPIILASVFALSAVAVPAGAQTELHGVCANPQGLPVVATGMAFDEAVETPVGALGLGDVVDHGTVLVSLEGLPKTTTVKSVKVNLTWSGAASDLSDYDMVVNGAEFTSSEAGTESTSLNRGHCTTVQVGSYVYTGTPLDAMNLKINI